MGELWAEMQEGEAEGVEEPPGHAESLREGGKGTLKLTSSLSQLDPILLTAAPLTHSFRRFCSMSKPPIIPLPHCILIP